MLYGKFSLVDLRFEAVDLFSSEMRPGQKISQRLNLMFEINDVRMQGMTHGLGKNRLL